MATQKKIQPFQEIIPTHFLLSRLAHDEAPGPYITNLQYRFNKTKQHTRSYCVVWSVLSVCASSRPLSCWIAGLWSAIKAAQASEIRVSKGQRASRSHSCQWRTLFGWTLWAYGALLTLVGGHHCVRALRSFEVRKTWLLRLVSPRIHASLQTLKTVLYQLARGSAIIRSG